MNDIISSSCDTGLFKTREAAKQVNDSLFNYNKIYPSFTVVFFYIIISQGNLNVS